MFLNLLWSFTYLHQNKQTVKTYSYLNIYNKLLFAFFFSFTRLSLRHLSVYTFRGLAVKLLGILLCIVYLHIHRLTVYPFRAVLRAVRGKTIFEGGLVDENAGCWLKQLTPEWSIKYWKYLWFKPVSPLSALMSWSMEDINTTLTYE